MRRAVGLRKPLRSKSNGNRISRVESIAAPVLGWNTRDPIASMNPGYAITLDDIFPTAGDLMLRKGIDDHVTGIGSQVESLMPYNEPDGTQTLFCAAGTAFYNTTTAGAVGAAVVSSLSNARWQSINYTNSSGVSYLCCFNGTDSPRFWNGTSWITITGASTPAITGLTTSGIVSATVHMRRMWLVQVESMKAWYLPVDAVGGAAASLDLSGIAKRGGYIMAIESWSMDGGDGMNDYWAAITSEGEVVVYQGSDPSSANTWALVGVWYLGEPIGRRCMLKFGGDVLLILAQGVIPLSKLIMSKALDNKSAITDLIAPSMLSAALSYKTNFGWELTHYTSENMLLLNVPVNEGLHQQQYVMNVITGAWCRFTGYEVNCMTVMGGELYAGRNGAVSKLWSTHYDNGVDITGELKSAFNYFGSTSIKSFKMIRPIVATNGSPELAAGMNVDYENTDNTATATYSGTTLAKWGISLWGIGLWASGLPVLRNWIELSKEGICGSSHIVVTAGGFEVHLQAADFMYESGEGV